jgi:glycosyltransferase involved in cell wall biosynthesis
MDNLKVSIIIPVYNALYYTKKCLTTLKKTRGISYEIIVVDNNSRFITRLYLTYALSVGRINYIHKSKDNLYFAKGNNLGVSLTSSDSTHVLLMNSDVRIDSPDWLYVLLSRHKRGATGFGYLDSKPERADGYCLLIDKDLYKRYRLDESLPWWWSVTKLQAQLLKDGFDVQAIKKHERYLHHYGGKSKVDPLLLNQSAGYSREEVIGWFGDKKITVIERV